MFWLVVAILIHRPAIGARLTQFGELLAVACLRPFKFAEGFQEVPGGRILDRGDLLCFIEEIVGDDSLSVAQTAQDIAGIGAPALSIGHERSP
ncbi:hypothetical protein TW79_22765 [Tritonibacter mobilis]|uniref:Uncharacterized protein n=1 Tax=Tritonibacter mobilis F1926 TaxID=1265309 RepID=A0A1B1A7B7_9RHOB|nr:hypothetical protein K529_016755 [Tritonibacter mobilis F1926]KJZ21383.1 hypothetical protein TW79_22765 [Tritonibacter mobilis]